MPEDLPPPLSPPAAPLPQVFTPATAPSLSASITRALAEELAVVPPNALTVTAYYREGESLRVAAAARIGEDWVLGGFVERTPTDLHAGAGVTWHF